MLRKSSISLFLYLPIFLLASNASTQNGVSVPVSEVTLRAGEEFSVILHTAALKQTMRVDATYANGLGTNVPYPISDRFTCTGRGDRGDSEVRLHCKTSRALPGGDYRVYSRNVVFTRLDTNESKVYEFVRLPIVTLTSDPFEPSMFPDDMDASLFLTNSQALSDGVVKSQRILDELNDRFRFGMRDSRENRAYLLSRIGEERAIIAEAKRRFIPTLTPNADPDLELRTSDKQPRLPILFEDFDNRLNAISKNLRADADTQSASVVAGRSHLVLAQMPKGQDSVDVPAGKDVLHAALRYFVGVLTDFVQGGTGALHKKCPFEPTLCAALGLFVQVEFYAPNSGCQELIF